MHVAIIIIIIEDDLEDRVKMMVQLRSQLDVQVKSNVKAAQEKQKKHYDRLHQEGSRPKSFGKEHEEVV